jgi:hypothetical protein
MSLQAEALAMQEENQKLRERANDLANALDFAKGLRSKNPSTWRKETRFPTAPAAGRWTVSGFI